MKPIDLPALLKRIETRFLLKALRFTQNNRSKAAQLLGMNRTTVVEKMRAAGVLESMPSSFRGGYNHQKPEGEPHVV